MGQLTERAAQTGPLPWEGQLSKLRGYVSEDEDWTVPTAIDEDVTTTHTSPAPGQRSLQSKENQILPQPTQPGGM